MGSIVVNCYVTLSWDEIVLESRLNSKLSFENGNIMQILRKRQDNSYKSYGNDISVKDEYISLS